MRRLVRGGKRNQVLRFERLRSKNDVRDLTRVVERGAGSLTGCARKMHSAPVKKHSGDEGLSRPLCRQNLGQDFYASIRAIV